jgi:hypothetical protein
LDEKELTVKNQTMLKGKHNVAEVEGIRCTIVETGANEGRMTFLRDLLVHNGYTVKAEKEKAKDGKPLETFVVGVTDLVFNPVIRLYQKKLFRKEGLVVNPAYWNQWPGQWDIPYYEVQR